MTPTAATSAAAPKGGVRGRSSARLPTWSQSSRGWTRMALVRWAVAGLFALAGIFPADVAVAEPYTPKSDDEVLERLAPALVSDRAAQGRQELAGDPENLRGSLVLAARYLESAEVEGDTRFFGYARAILRPWWDSDPRPPGVALVRARIHLALWEWDDAARELSGVRSEDSEFGEAAVLLVEQALGRGDVPRASEILARLESRMPPLEKELAAASVRRLSATPETALESVRDARTAATNAFQRARVLGLEADLLAQLGRFEEADARHAEASALAPRHVGLRAALADQRLDRGRAGEVVTLLRSATTTDALELRVLEGMRAEANVDAAELDRRAQVVTEWLERAERRRERGDPTVLTPLVRAYLRVRPDPARALEVARELWDARRGLDEARWCLEAAAAGDQGAGLRDDVRSWAQRHGIRDARWPVTPVGNGKAP